MNTAKKTIADYEKLFGKCQPGEKAFTLRPVIVRSAHLTPTAPEVTGRCCESAKCVSCVCRVSWECPTHGTRCIGSHD